MGRKLEIVLNSEDNWFTEAIKEREENESSAEHSNDTDNSNVIYVDFRKDM